MNARSKIGSLRRLSLAWKSVIFQVVILHFTPLFAMPFSDYTDAMGNIRLEMLSRNGSGVLSGIAPELDPVTGVDVALTEPEALGDASVELELSGEINAERLDEAEIKELGRFYDSLTNRNTQSEDWGRQDAEDLATDLGQDIDRFAAEQTQSGGRIAIAEAAAAAQSQGQQTPSTQIMVVRRPRSPAEDIPILSSVRLGTIAVEVLRPEIRANPLIGAAYHEFRQFLMIEERQSASILMYDQSAGTGILMTVEDGAAVTPGNGQPEQSTDPAAQRTIKRGPIFDNRPLRDVLIDLLTSKLAIVIYAILLTCWLAWRYVIRKYA